MVATVKHPLQPTATLNITWEKLPDDFPLDEEPVDNTGQPLIAGALREALELADYIKPEMLVASNFGLCATINGDLVIKAPDWLYIPSVIPSEKKGDRRSYTPHLEGENASLVMEFLSHNDGGEYSVKRTYPPGKWFFYERILQVPTYVIFEPEAGLLEVYRLQEGRYELELPDPEGRHRIGEMELFLGTWRGEKGGRDGYWLRWWDENGNLLLWGAEKLERERREVEEARQQAEEARNRADRLAEYLRARGMNPDEID